MLVGVILLAFGTAYPASGETLWFEAEDAPRGNFPPAAQNPFGPEDAEQADLLSEGEWVGVAGDHGGRFLEFDLQIPAEGEYQLFARKFWKHGPYRWRITQAGEATDWTQVGRDVGLLDAATLRLHTVANWTAAGTVDLDAGPATLRVELTTTEGAAAFDAFVLTSEGFVARGKMKPGDKYADVIDVPAGWFAFEPDADREDALFSLASLNEDEAGSKGYIVPEGEQFIHQDTGEVVRFWGVNAGGGIAEMDRPSIDRLAKFLARRGVNLIRYHGTTYPGRGDLTVKDREKIDRTHYLVAAMKREGIYTCLSIYFPLWVRLDEADGWAGYDDQIPFALLYFDPKFQEIYRNWWRDLMLAENPYTGMPLARDPAVAMAEIINEDSFFFWTFTPGQNIPAEQMTTLNDQFGDWLAEKYGSEEDGLKRWNGASDRKVEVPTVWRLFNVRDAWSQDATAFLADRQRGFYEETVAFLEDEIGFNGSIYASNWTTASPRYLEPLEKWTYFAADFTDRHGYYEGFREGEGANFSVREGHLYTDRAGPIFQPADGSTGSHSFSMPLMNAVYVNDVGPVPSMISEFDWALPNRFRADQTLIASAYSRLQGMDAPVFFALTSPGWMSQVTKWPLQGPDTMGQFPAFAFLYRQGLVDTAPPAVEMTVGIDHVKQLGGAPVVGTINLDELRAADVPEGETVNVEGVESIDPRAFFVGQVRYGVLDSDAEPTVRTIDLSDYIDDSAKVIRSMTGQHEWDYDKGIIKVMAPQAAAVTGFLSRGDTLELGPVSMSSPMEFGTIALVSLDDQPIDSSSLMLLQVMSEMKNFGYETADAGQNRKRITNLGGPPILVKQFAGTVTLPSGDYQVTPLAPDLAAGGDAFASDGEIELRPDVMYYLVRSN
jgi:hypothetical protein